MGRRTRIFSIAFGVALCLLGGTSATICQVLGQPYRLSDKEMVSLLDRTKKETNRFRNSLKDALNKSRFDRNRGEDNINEYVKAFAEEAARLDDQFDHHKSTGAEVQSVLDRSVRIDDFMRRYPLTSRAQNDWSALRADLVELAQAYNVSWRWGGYSSIGSPSSPVVSDAPYRLTDKEVEQIIHRIENQSDKFRSSLDSALDDSRFNGSRGEDDINAFVKLFYEETKRLHDRFDDHKSTSADVQSVLDRAARIDQFMRRYALTERARNDWSLLRGNLDELARVYDVQRRWGL